MDKSVYITPAFGRIYCKCVRRRSTRGFSKTCFVFFDLTILDLIFSKLVDRPTKHYKWKLSPVLPSRRILNCKCSSQSITISTRGKRSAHQWVVEIAYSVTFIQKFSVWESDFLIFTIYQEYGWWWNWLYYIVATPRFDLVLSSFVYYYSSFF